MQFLTNGPQAHWQTIEQAFIKACSIAHEEILVQTPYFLPPEGLLMSLCSAALRGVHVSVMLPERGDSYLTQRASDSYLTQLLQAGVDVDAIGVASYTPSYWWWIGASWASAVRIWTFVA